ncbi:hypothetical protein D3C87_1795510 [compost metagenome]
MSQRFVLHRHHFRKIDDRSRFSGTQIIRTILEVLLNQSPLQRNLITNPWILQSLAPNFRKARWGHDFGFTGRHPTQHIGKEKVQKEGITPRAVIENGSILGRKPHA